MIRDTYLTLQNLQTYYQIGDVDVDRYLIDGETRQVLIAARGLNSADLPSQSFVNRHIVYTHGYGAVASPSNQADPDGNPTFYLRDVPVNGNGIKMQNGPPSQIYFAENLGSYVLTGAEQAEFNYQQAGATDQFTRYKGKDGVKLSNIVRARRVRAALREPRPVDLGSDHLEHQAAHGARHPRPGHQARAVPPVRRRPLPGRARRPHRLDHGRVHHHRPVPVRQSLSGRGLARQVVQLRAQLGEGHRRRLPGHGQVLRVRQEGPDHQVLPRGVPRPLHRRLADAGGDPGAPALPGGPVQVAVDDLRPLPRDRAEALLRRQREVAGLARPRLGPGLERHPVRGERRRGTASATSGSNQPQAATSTGARIGPYYLNIRLPDRSPNTIHRHGAVRAGVVGQQPDAPGVVPHRQLRPGAVREADRRSPCRRDRRCSGRCR